MEYIEAFFNEELSAERKKEFEQKIVADPVFAEEVAFYLSSKQAAHEEMKEEREKLRLLYNQRKHSNHIVRPQPALVRRLLPWAAAAAVLVAIVFSWYAWFKPVSPAGMAEKYIAENFQTVPVTMGDKEDRLQTGLSLYNEGKPDEALKQFENLVLTDTAFPDAKKYAGIVSLRLGQYDKAINYFSQLSNYTLHANPGKFYQALTLMRRNQPGDTEMAKQLLQQVVDNDLEGKKEAEKWLEKW